MTSETDRSSLTRFAWLSILAAVVTIALKLIAYRLTGSVGLLSDAIESLVNLVGGIMALAMLTIAARPADEDHPYGHSKAEYFSSGVEGSLILLAAASIAFAGVSRLINPKPLEQVGLGLVVSVCASLVNLAVALLLLRVGRKRNSITLEANAQHLLTDVWTSVGVVLGVGAVALTGWQRLDPLVALAVAANIIWTGIGIVRRSAAGLMDSALSAEDLAAVQRVLQMHREAGLQFHKLQTRQGGARKFVSVHVQVPGDWTVDRGHDMAGHVASDIRKALPEAHVATHIEPFPAPGSELQSLPDHAPDKELFNFSAATDAPAWQIVNDDVMGGVSVSTFNISNGVAVFRGELSLKNNGGFASVRSSPGLQNLTGLDSFVVRARGDGRKYKFTVRTDSGYDTPIYQCAFTTKRAEWEEHRLAFKDFIPTFRGRVLTDVPPFDAANVVSIGFLISDKQEGPFELDVAWIKASRDSGK